MINQRLQKSLILILFMVLAFKGHSQEYWDNITGRPSTLGVEKGFVEVKTAQFHLKLVKASQTVAGLAPAEDTTFNFTPGERLKIRDKDSLYHLGDINLMLKTGQGQWKDYSSAYTRKPVSQISSEGNILAASDMANTFPKDIPLSIKRYYENDNGDLVLRFVLTNPGKESVEIGALGIPMVFNNILEGKSLDEAHADNVFFDPYIGMDAGYLEVKHLNGKGTALLVLPQENMPFQAYRPLLNDPTRRSIVFEGFHEWMPLSKAYAETQWKGVKQWNTPTSTVLQPGEKRDFAIKFVLAKNIREIQQTVLKNKMPVAVGIPGYVLPQDVDGRLFVKSPSEVKKITIKPEGAVSIRKKETLKNGYVEYMVEGQQWGRARIVIEYKDGKQQTINYKIIKPEAEVIANLGNFLTTKQWFDNEKDPFNRAPSVISYDYEAKQQVAQDSRAWIAGLSDEGGAGSWLAAMMKQYAQPDKDEIEKLSGFVHKTLWGGIQYADGKNKYGVKKSMFYYQPDSMPKNTYNDTVNYKTWAAWNHKHANDPGRSYNYPHVTAAYWVMYRLARYHTKLVTEKPWNWYLKQAYHTAIAMTKLAPYYAQFGQMEGTVFLCVLKDLQHEGLDELALDLEQKMKARADHWKSLNYPFGSEMPWDSTGQEEVFMWSDYFGYAGKANVTLNAILAYMPTMPHWAYNGNARRYWDFLYGGKLSRVERQIHHYGSALNAIPVLKAYQNSPNDFYLLKVGYGGLMGGIANITEDGFGPAAFHSFPQTLAIDYLSGDYGSGFFGYAVNSASYLTKTANFGWVSFGGNIKAEKKQVEMSLTTAARNKVFIAPEALLITLDAGSMDKVIYNEEKRRVILYLNPKNEYTPNAYIRTNKKIELPFKKDKGAFLIPLKNSIQPIEIQL
ncbi:DUF5695 domain-containing protein [Galbibacter pacificus]|uniref:DUF5695 domain-containing protein n=1 Tax=Galbibacter pacificus TaxID=2996052 RepID=A0ABT6FR58_9FLAO|nr:DUF5695 domain-containing protein [Galbibacter pacificus]MDG3581811.1 DUF5695 domain-containing protein [Galbibacter pacificus]MDG3585715.1 DUF5695 domain-containing protein [Galbibacter pacificus]